MILRAAMLLAILTGGLLIPATSSAAPNAIKSEPAFYIDTYGEVRPEQDPEVARAHKVFDAVRAVADKSAKRLPKLVVVRSKADPWAIALPSGHVILSKEAVSICHRQASTAEAEARLAFVLGHELAHLAHDDFWHQEVYSFLSQHSGTQALAHFMQTQERGQDQELKADDKGFIYAAIAGYPMETLLAKGQSSSDFFNYWLAQTSARTQTAHLAANVRADRHQQRLRELQGKLAFFHFGVRLSHFDYCDDAVYFFQEFQKYFPGREVLNNLGFCQLQMARREMKPEHADFYWMPSLLDAQVRTTSPGTRGGEPATLKALRQAGLTKAEPFLRDAVEYLQQAAKADPGYVPARTNLAIAQLYMGQPHQARAVLDEVRQLEPDNVDAQILEALTLYEQSDSGLDLWSTAVERLEKLATGPRPSPVALFNLARLNAIRPRPGEAKSDWNRLAAYAEGLPASILVQVCQNQSDGPGAGCKRPAPKSTPAAPWTWPVATEGFKQISEPFLPDWQKTEFDWVKDKLHGHIYRQADGKAEVLELDGFVHMQVLHGENLGKVDDLSGYCAGGLRHRSLAQGDVWTCDHWAARVMDDRVEEVWWVAE